MKILLINNCHYRKGGSEAVYFNTAELLKSHGHEVIFFSNKRDMNLPCEQSKYFPELGGNIKQMISFFHNSEAARNLEQLIEAEKPDIAHAHLFWGGLSPSIFKVLKRHNIPLVHTAHDYRLVCPGYTFKDGSGAECERCKRWNYYECALHKCSRNSVLPSIIMATEMYTRQLWRNPLKNIDGFIFVSHFSEHKHIEHHCEYKTARHIVLYNYTRPSLSPAIGDKEDYFLFYGRLSFEKGIPTLLKAFDKHPELKLKVVGNGPLAEDLKNNYKGVDFLGYKTGEELFDLVRKARFVCVPSECFENNPMTIVESYSLGTPVIGSAIGGIPEIINDGQTGYLFSTGNVAELEKTIVKAATIKDDDYRLMCENAYKFYEGNFSEEEHYKRLISFYEEVLESKRGHNS